MQTRTLFHGLCALSLLMVISGCSQLLPRADSRAEPAPVEDIGGRSSGPVMKPGEPAQRAPSSGGSATRGLLAQADQLQQKGELEAAAAALERALRIEPRNGRLWHRLAAIRQAQGKSSLAANLAAKSNSLAAGDQDLIEKNNEIIREAKNSR